MFREDNKHLSYWLGHALPVIVVLVDTQRRAWLSLQQRPRCAGRWAVSGLDVRLRAAAPSQRAFLDAPTPGQAHPHHPSYRGSHQVTDVDGSGRRARGPMADRPRLFWGSQDTRPNRCSVASRSVATLREGQA
ncbi:DUF4365 domain-containing protein [Catenulispora pinisilvae]|uniref:DUF4365 domain-containing protein n=1 Tax=Catenulispora pinisilvae TaxID=2705253 RepID=UPI0018924FEF